MKPILFNTEMVRAILDGRKTVTRRVVKPQPMAKLSYCCMGDKYGTWAYLDKNAWDHWAEAYKIPDHIPKAETGRHWVPPCHIGDILYVRETWAIVGTDGMHHKYGYKADNEWLVPLWRPSIHMPREAARIFLLVTGMRVERLQKMEIADFKAEGIIPCRPENLPGHGCDCAWKHDGCLNRPCANRDAYEYWCWTHTFLKVWDSTIKAADSTLYGWIADPWVWVMEFERIGKREAELGGRHAQN